MTTTAGSYQHLAYSYTKEEQEINPESADLELTEFQQSAITMMEAALLLANRTIRNEHLFNVTKLEAGGTSPPPLSVRSETVTKFVTPETYTTERPSAKKQIIKANTKAPEGELSNTVESDLDPSYNIADTNARQVDEYDEEAASSKSDSVRVDVCKMLVTLGALFLYTYFTATR